MPCSHPRASKSARPRRNAVAWQEYRRVRGDTPNMRRSWSHSPVPDGVRIHAPWAKGTVQAQDNPSVPWRGSGKGVERETGTALCPCVPSLRVGRKVVALACHS